MKRIVSALDATQTLELERDLLRRADLNLVTVTTIEQLVAAAHEGAQLCLVGPLLPDGDARDALEAIRADDALADVPVVLVATPAISDRMGTWGFAGVLSLPLEGSVDDHLGALLESPQRLAPRRRGFARVRDDQGVAIGHAIDLSESGLLVRTRRATKVGEQLAVSIDFPAIAAPIAARARVARVIGDKVAIAFEAPSADLRAALLDAAGAAPTPGLSFRPRDDLGARGAELGGSFAEGPALAVLGERVTLETPDPVRLVLRDLLPFDEAMLDRFLELLAAVSAIEVHACPRWLAELAARMPVLSNRLHIYSMAFAVRCPSCGDAFDDRVTLAVLDRTAAEVALRAAVETPCLVCGGALSLVDLPAASLAFLTK